MSGQTLALRVRVRARRRRPPSDRRRLILAYRALSLAWLVFECLAVFRGHWLHLIAGAVWVWNNSRFHRSERQLQELEEQGFPVPPVARLEWALLAFSTLALAWLIVV